MIRTETITSIRNPLLRDIRRAVQKGGLTPDGFCVAGTFHLLEEALRSRRPVPAVLVTRSAAGEVEARLRRGGAAGTRLLLLEDDLLAEVSGTETAQGVVALVEPPAWKLEDLFRGCPLVLALDGVQDPGNAGALVRAAEAFGATGVVFLKGSAHPFHVRTIRASAGSLFRLPAVPGLEAGALVVECVRRRVAVFAAVAHGGRMLDEAGLTKPCLLAIGSEAQGVGAVLKDAAAGLRIPTHGVESLNAAAAGAVLLYEAAQQRRGRVA